MKAGMLRHVVIIQQVTETRDGFGGISESWSTFATRRAHIGPIKGKEYIAAKAVNSKADVEMRLRYVSGLITKMRVLWGSRIYNVIDAINIDERGKEHRLMCEEVVL